MYGARPPREGRPTQIVHRTHQQRNEFEALELQRSYRISPTVHVSGAGTSKFGNGSIAFTSATSWASSYALLEHYDPRYKAVSHMHSFAP